MTSKIPEPDLNYLQKVLLEMLAIPSPTGFTDTIVRYVAERLEELGIPFEMTRRGTIRATLKGKKNSPDRAVSAHLDTIGAAVRAIKDNDPGAGRLLVQPFCRGQPGQPVHRQWRDSRQRVAADGFRARLQHRRGRNADQLGSHRTAPGCLLRHPRRL